MIGALCSVLAAVLLLMFAPTASATSIVASADTAIVTHPGFGGPTSTHGHDDYHAAIGTPDWSSFLLIMFDLSSYRGQTVVGPGTLSLNRLYT